MFDITVMACFVRNLRESATLNLELGEVISKIAIKQSV